MKKPTAQEFADIVDKCGGNMTDAAKMLNVSRQTIYNWMKEDDEFSDVVKDSRKQLFDSCLERARIVALGIPKIKDGKLVGWVERPDPSMLRYLMSTLGKDEGFGNSVDVTSLGDKLPTVINVLESDEPIEK